MSNKYLDKIKKNFYNTYPDLTESSRNIIMRNFIMLHKAVTGNEEIKSLNFIYKKNNILKYLEKYNYLTRRNYIHALNYIITSNLKSDKAMKMNETYTIIRNELSKQYMDKAQKNEMSEKTKENWLTMNEYNDMLKRMKLTIDSFNFDNLQSKQYTTLQKYVIFNIYKYHPIRVDLHNMTTINEDEDEDLDENFNYFIKLNNGNYQIKLFVFKTKKKHNEIIIDLNTNLNDIIKMFLDINKSGWFITEESNKSKPIQKRALTNLINRGFQTWCGKKVGVNLIRKIVVSDRFAEKDKQQKLLAKDMGHTQQTNQLYIKYND